MRMRVKEGPRFGVCACAVIILIGVSPGAHSPEQGADGSLLGPSQEHVVRMPWNASLIKIHTVSV